MDLVSQPGEPWPAEHVELFGRLDAVLRASAFPVHLGAELLGWGPGWARLEMVARPEHTNLVGSVHGGVLASLADSAFEVACNGHGRVSVAVELSCHYTAAAPAGARLEAIATEVTRSRRTASYDLAVRADGALVARFLALAFRTERWHLGEQMWPEPWRSER